MLLQNRTISKFEKVTKIIDGKATKMRKLVFEATPLSPEIVLDDKAIRDKYAVEHAWVLWCNNDLRLKDSSADVYSACREPMKISEIDKLSRPRMSKPTAKEQAMKIVDEDARASALKKIEALEALGISI